MASISARNWIRSGLVGAIGKETTFGIWSLDVASWRSLCNWLSSWQRGKIARLRVKQLRRRVKLLAGGADQDAGETGHASFERLVDATRQHLPGGRCERRREQGAAHILNREMRFVQQKTQLRRRPGRAVTERRPVRMRPKAVPVWHDDDETAMIGKTARRFG